MTEAVLILIGAAGLDAVWGDPVYGAHPIRLIGRVIGGAERVLFRTGMRGRLGGALLVALVVVVVGVAYRLPGMLLPRGEWFWDLFVLYSCLGMKDLVRHARAVCVPLADGQMDSARGAVQRIVGRDVSVLDQAGIARAAVESVAESVVDAGLSPLSWYVVGCLLADAAGLRAVCGGVLAVLIFKAVSTLDSMVGYRNARYMRFGTVAARFDDALNFVPARLSVGVIALAAAGPAMSARSAWRIGLRDRLKHESPNAGHAESAFAGALGLRLGGPTRYMDRVAQKPWLGDGRSAATAEDIRAACRLACRTYSLGLLLVALVLGCVATLG